MTKKNRLLFAAPSLLALMLGVGFALGDTGSGLSPLAGSEAQAVVGGAATSTCPSHFINFEPPPGTGCNGGTCNSCCPHQPNAQMGAPGSGAQLVPNSQCQALLGNQCGTVVGRAPSCGS